MLSVGIVSTGGVGYYMQTVGSGVDDYYARTGPGRWVGAGAEVLGLAGPVGAAQVDLLAAGCHPVTGEPLGTRPGKVTAFDLTFSCPKSVSLLAELSGPGTRGQVSEAHRSAVDATLRFIESEGVLVGRRGHGGVRRMPTNGAVAAAFEHRTSRAGDPQTHTHLLVFNRAEGIDGRWAGIDGRRLFAWAKTAGYVYQAALRAELTERLGVDWRPVRNGVAELAGLTDAQLEVFSTRRGQIEAALERSGHTGAHAAQLAALATRPAKPEPVEPEVQRAAWRQKAEEIGVDAERLSAICGRNPGLPAPPQHDLSALAAALADPSGLTAHRSTFDRRDVIRAVAELAAAGARPWDLSAGATEVLSRPEFVATGAHSNLSGLLYSTVELMEVERSLLASAERRVNEGAGICPADAVEATLHARPGLSSEQQQMVQRLCLSGRGLEVVIGRGGTGKTFALDAARQAWTDSGRVVIGAALAARTAAGLQAGTGIPSTTVDQLLSDLARPGAHSALPHRGVLVIDEAGMVGTRKLARLLEAAERTHTKVVLVGDPRQLPEVEAGGAFAALASRDPIELTVNRRQAAEWERRALDELRHGDVARAVTVYRDRQRITLAATADAARDQMVADWWATRQDKGADKAVMIALHQADVDDLNLRARRLRQLNGELDGPRLQTGSGREFSLGDEVMALRNDRRLGVLNGTRAEVTAVDLDARSVEVRTSDGRHLHLPAGYLDEGHLAHGYAITAHKGQGMTTSYAFVLGSDRLYREAGYTALSRAVEATNLYQVAPPTPGWQPASDPHQDLTRLLSRSGAQTLATRPDPLLDRSAIRDTALADPGEHLLQRLGPPPPSGPGRDAWAAAATAIDTYRIRHHITGPDPLGPRPAEATAAREWEHAHAAALEVDRRQEIAVSHSLEI